MNKLQLVSLLSALLSTFIANGLQSACEFTFSQKCVYRSYGDCKMVCVCSENDCEPIGRIVQPAAGQFIVYESTEHGLRFKSTVYDGNELPSSSEKHSSSFEITIDPHKKYQKIIGFGGAFTDSTGINLLNLPTRLADSLIRDYFSEEGLNYTVGRVPIGGSDFSTRAYTYDDDFAEDFNLTHFSLAEEDWKYKVCCLCQLDWPA